MSELVLLRLLRLLCRLGDGELLRFLGIGEWLLSHLGEGDRVFLLTEGQQNYRERKIQ